MIYRIQKQHRHAAHSTIRLFFVILVLIALPTQSQNYVDILQLNYGTMPKAGFENSTKKNSITSFNTGVLGPVRLSKSTVLLSGFDYKRRTVALFNEDKSTLTLSNVTLKIGASLTHNPKFSGTYLLLPKIANNNINTTKNGLFLGAAILFKYQKNKHLQYRFGLYSSSEAFGTIMTPILGFHFLSKKKTLEATANLPINFNINYQLNKKWNLGVQYNAPVRTFSIATSNKQLYVQETALDLSSYAQYQLFSKSLLVRCHVGYNFGTFELFQKNDTLPIRLAAFEFGDQRTLQSMPRTGSLFVKLGLIYRYNFL